ncbi:hypothetical protein HXX76_009763 [Chlamydomonas incerta]|uniref:Uncharacterized protein n=1 Tax=Chlamydomonas incerta TaxID=51695 RepID=A0A835T2F7_CHLIN|nr:hypothetical protein HXX76_009763 [Chlamydomonas incerta]|eukprot:KAG2431235.1 hypothetical protein HXX76_009763 [Chlamydomonas incerta]
MPPRFRWHSTVRGRNITRASALLPVYARAAASHCDDPEARRAALQRALQYKQQLQQAAAPTTAVAGATSSRSGLLREWPDEDLQQQAPPVALRRAAPATTVHGGGSVTVDTGGPTPPVVASQHPSQQPPQAAALAAALAAAAAAASCGGGGGGGLCFDALDVLLDQIDKMDAAMLAGIGPVSEAAAGEQGGLIDDALMAELLGPAPAEPQPAAQIQQMPVQVVDDAAACAAAAGVRIVGRASGLGAASLRPAVPATAAASRRGHLAAGGAGNSSSALAYPAGDGVVVTDAHCTLGLREADMQQVLGGGGWMRTATC